MRKLWLWRTPPSLLFFSRKTTRTNRLFRVRSYYEPNNLWPRSRTRDGNYRNGTRTRQSNALRNARWIWGPLNDTSRKGQSPNQEGLWSVPPTNLSRRWICQNGIISLWLPFAHSLRARSMWRTERLCIGGETNLKREILKEVNQHLISARNLLKIMKNEDVRARRKAKATQKPKWSRSIKATNATIDALITVRQVVRKIPKRV